MTIYIPKIVFLRGQTFKYILDVADQFDEPNYEDRWLPMSHIRRYGTTGSKGLIARVNAQWLQDGRLLLFHNMTDKWPALPAVIDVLLTDDNQTMRLPSMTVEILPGITTLGD